MGYFSWNCKVCGKSLRSKDAETDERLTQVVILEYNGEIFIGEYDGYGRVVCNDGHIHQIAYGIEPECYHWHCWISIGLPAVWTKSSEKAEDQGYFCYDDDL